MLSHGKTYFLDQTAKNLLSHGKTCTAKRALSRQNLLSVTAKRAFSRQSLLSHRQTFFLRWQNFLSHGKSYSFKLKLALSRQHVLLRQQHLLVHGKTCFLTAKLTVSRHILLSQPAKLIFSLLHRGSLGFFKGGWRASESRIHWRTGEENGDRARAPFFLPLAWFSLFRSLCGREAQGLQSVWWGNA